MPSASNLRHHETGFRNIELSDVVKESKKKFNVNSTTRSVTKYDAAAGEVTNRFKRGSAGRSQKRYNVVSGAPEEYSN